MVEGRGSMWALERLVTTWAGGAREAEIERIVRVLKDVLQDRGHNVPPCERKNKEEVESLAARVLTRLRQCVERILELRVARRDGQRSELVGIIGDAGVRREG